MLNIGKHDYMSLKIGDPAKQSNSLTQDETNRGRSFADCFQLYTLSPQHFLLFLRDLCYQSLVR